jgi:outer membrane protein assembly factor BamB
VTSLDGCLYCLSTLDGAVRWTFSTRGPIVTPVTLTTAGDVLLGSTDASVYLVHGVNGGLRFEVPTGWQVGPPSPVPACRNDQRAPQYRPRGKCVRTESQHGFCLSVAAPVAAR